MKKVIFIIETDHYSKETLSKCLDKYTEADSYHFFNKEEMMMYLNLNPSLIICGDQEFELSKEDVAKMKNSMESLPKVYKVEQGRVLLSRIKKNGIKQVKKLKYMNLYASLTSLVNNVKHSRRASVLQMY